MNNMRHRLDKPIRKVHRLPDILISVAPLVAGIILIKYIPSWNWLGISLLIAGVFMLPFYRTGYKLKDINGIFKKEEIILPNECKNEIASFIEGVSQDLIISPFYKGGLLLELYYSRDKSRLFGQIFNYESDVYTPQCQLSEIDSDKLSVLRRYQS